MLGYKKNIPNVLRNVLVIVYFTPLSNMCRPQQRRSTQISATNGLAEILAQIYSMAIINRSPSDKHILQDRRALSAGNRNFPKKIANKFRIKSCRTNMKSIHYIRAHPAWHHSNLHHHSTTTVNRVKKHLRQVTRICSRVFSINTRPQENQENAEKPIKGKDRQAARCLQQHERDHPGLAKALHLHDPNLLSISPSNKPS
jgi:hypothetical protein